jgi:hypothetical protein
MSVPGFSAEAINGAHGEMLAAYEFNILWYTHSAQLQRALHFMFGIGIILGQVATLSSFAFVNRLPSETSPVLAAVTSALVAVFGFLSPTAKWRDFRTAQFELMSQRLLYRMDISLAADAASQRAVIVKYGDMGMRVINATASSYWRQVAKSAEQLKTAAPSEASVRTGAHEERTQSFTP